MSDEIKKFLAYEGRIAITCASTTDLVEKSRHTHEFSPTVTAAFGRMITMAVMLAVDMKNDTDKLTIQIKGNGAIGTMVSVANNTPKVKGYVSNPFVDIPLNEDGKIDVGGAVGCEGYINIIKDIGLKKPYIGICPLISGEIAEDFANYLVTSEQKRSAVALGVLINKDGVKSAGGYIINAMPDATDDDICKIEQAIFKAGAISKMLNNNLTLEEIAKKITGDENVKLIEENIKPSYECDCNKEHMKEGIKAIGKEELKNIIEQDEKAEVVCHFCNNKYNFTKDELEELLLKI